MLSSPRLAVPAPQDHLVELEAVTDRQPGAQSAPREPARLAVSLSGGGDGPAEANQAEEEKKRQGE